MNIVGLKQIFLFFFVTTPHKSYKFDCLSCQTKALNKTDSINYTDLPFTEKKKDRTYLSVSKHTHFGHIRDAKTFYINAQCVCLYIWIMQTR